jgi:hypothetical protein
MGYSLFPAYMVLYEDATMASIVCYVITTSTFKVLMLNPGLITFTTKTLQAQKEPRKSLQI